MSNINQSTKTKKYVVTALFHRKRWIIYVNGKNGYISTKFYVPLFDRNDKRFKRKVKKATNRLNKQYDGVTVEMVENAIKKACNYNKFRPPKYLSN